MAAILINGYNIISIATALLLAEENYSVEIWYEQKNQNYQCIYFYDDIEKGSLHKIVKKIDLPTLALEEYPVVDTICIHRNKIDRLADFEGYIQSLKQIFPGESEKLDEYYQVITALGVQWLDSLTNGEIDFVRHKKMMEYSQIGYSQFLDKLFVDPNIKAVLQVGIPTSTVSLNVMAGHLFSQIFVNKRASGGLQAVWEHLERLALRNKNIKAYNKKAVNLEMNCKTDNQYLIEATDGSQHRFGVVINTERTSKQVSGFGKSLGVEIKFKDEHGVQNPLWLLSETVPSVKYLEKVINNQPNEISDFFCIAWRTANDRLRVYLTVSESMHHEDNYKLILDEIYQRLNAIGIATDNIAGTEVFGDEEFFSNIGFADALHNQWGFSVTQTNKNPVKLKDKNGILQTHQWGGAWFTISYLAYINAAKEVEG
ncbi:hypothetical protein E0485_11930 [Paenibacillus albiflavus]|uniref:Uncharacterized protein n=1 Tax=Paenibacillus albiflavus TaxID=2545760 RepID=A0A4R4ED87_9BACL|nr:hypothetical protein [Paenibacillus albiflavus]TCZ77163.1 hypothetical protein E0485_11930 [Paenibacillus albiflavus]